MLKLKKIYLILFILAFLLVVFLASSISSITPSFLSIFKDPFYLTEAIRREFNGLIFYHHNYLENEQLKREVDFLKAKLNSAQEASQENSRLKSLLSFKQKSTYKLIAAKVIARSPESWGSNIIIDKGRSSGIRKGMAVVNYLGLVGRVFEVGEGASKVLLISDPNLGVSSLIQRSRQEGLVCGTLGSALIMRYLPEDCDIKAGDIVVTSGLNQAFPKGILIGRVTEVGKEFSGLSSFALIRPAVNLANLEEALVVFQ